MRIALGIAYEGTCYHGWQFQENLITIQGRIQEALSKVANSPIEVICAGRTDKGVHAVGQVAHFDTSVTRELRAWILGTNTYLPPDIRVHWAQEVSAEFHARFSATARAYRYVIFNNRTHSAILHHHTSWHIYALNLERMQAAAQYFIGEHDFSSFRAQECQAKTAIRNVHYININKSGDFIILDIKANAFLHHMVRNIVGVLMEIGEGKKEPIWAQQVLAIKDRTQAGVTAPAEGLYLTEVTYPEIFQIPQAVESIFI